MFVFVVISVSCAGGVRFWVAWGLSESLLLTIKGEKLQYADINLTRTRPSYLQASTFYLWFVLFAYSGGTISKQDQFHVPDGRNRK